MECSQSEERKKERQGKYWTLCNVIATAEEVQDEGGGEGRGGKMLGGIIENRFHRPIVYDIADF